MKKQWDDYNSRDYVKDKKKSYSYENKEKRNKYSRKYNKEKYKNDSEFKLKSLVRVRIRHALKNNVKKSKSMVYLGCTVEEAVRHIESKFHNHPETNEKMTWDRLGNKKNTWQIDHIVELDRFDFSKEEDIIKAFNYQNIQPLWFEDHIKKTQEYKTQKRS